MRAHDCGQAFCPPVPLDVLPPNVTRPGDLPEFSGFVVLRLQREFGPGRGEDLIEVADELGLLGLARLVRELDSGRTRRVVSSVEPDQLLAIEAEAEPSGLRPLHSLTSYWRIDLRGTELDPTDVVTRLRRLPEVEHAYEELAVTDPVVSPADDTHNPLQDYLDAAPVGIDARWAWLQVNGDGAGVGLVDLEQGWLLNHEDLVNKTPTLIFNDNRDGVGDYVGNHGAAVLGEIVGVDNDRGVVGIAPGVTSVRATSHFDQPTGTALHVADATVAAINTMAAGDVLLLEVQRSFLPAEVDDADLDAIRLAVARGVVVIEAAGNGGFALDGWADSTGNTRLDRGSADFVESGAIMVGAATSAVPHERLGFSNYGSRIDCYGWGEDIATCGYGDLGGAGDTSYTDAFGGTSGASPMVTGAAILLQGMYEAIAGSRLSPQQMRLLLTDPATATAQGTIVAGDIGVMPNVRAIAETTLGLVPDVYLRDGVGDTGAVPSAGAISTSPDVIVRPTAVADPTAEFGEGSGTENTETVGFQVEAGQDNFVYTRFKNRGAATATDVTATIYWSEVATLVTPGMWNQIGTTAPVTVPTGNTLAVAAGLTWPAAQIPSTGHYCFVALASSPQDPAPPLPGPTDWGGFIAMVRNQNNVTWRNFNVVDVVPDPAGDPIVLPFLVVGAPDQPRRFHLEMLQDVPDDVQVRWELPIALARALPEGARLGMRVRGDRAQLAMPRIRSLPLCHVRLARDARFPCQLVVRPGKGLAHGLHRIALRQVFEDLEVGRVTWALRPKRSTEDR